MSKFRTVAVVLGLMLTLAACTGLECPNEVSRPLDRARFCGPSNPAP